MSSYNLLLAHSFRFQFLSCLFLEVSFPVAVKRLTFANLVLISLRPPLINHGKTSRLFSVSYSYKINNFICFCNSSNYGVYLYASPTECVVGFIRFEVFQGAYVTFFTSII